MDKKGALDLSINMLVILIISLVVLAGGVTLLYQFIHGAEELKDQLDEQTDAELERLLVDQGKLVALPLDKAWLQRGENHVFGLGILNIEDSSAEFRIAIEFSRYITKGGEDATTLEIKAEAQSWLLYITDTLLIEEHEHRKEPIAVVVPKNANSGTYIFNVKVYNVNLGKQHGNLQKFTVIVS